MKKYLILVLITIISISGYSTEKKYNCWIKNIKQLNSQEMTFDIWLSWDDIEISQFQAFQAGINFNYDEIANGGELSASFVSENVTFKSSNDKIRAKVVIDQSNHQIRLFTDILHHEFARLKTSSQQIKVVTVKISNSKNFATNSKPLFSWYKGMSNKSNSASVVLCYLKNNNHGSKITDLANHFVEESNLILNPSLSSDLNESNAFIISRQSITDFKLKFDYLMAGSSSLMIYDIQGKLVKQLKFETIEFQKEVKIYIEGLNKGIYIFKLQNVNQTYTQKVQF